MRLFWSGVLLASLLLSAAHSRAADMRMAVTTSFNNSGLSEVLLPAIAEDLGVELQLLVVGTGQALKLGRSGDVDAILVHSRAAEEQFVEEGYGKHRREIMYNDFVLVGPTSDPAGISRAGSAAEALALIRGSKSEFVSRGDDSGTHRKELHLWDQSNLDTNAFDASWYRSVGAGMGAALNTASGLGAYILTDRASWLKFKNKGELAILFSGDSELFNQYSFIQVSSAKHPHVKSGLAKSVETWLTSAKGQKLIADYQIDGETLFVPNAKELQ